jgi:hypothetical protein
MAYTVLAEAEIGGQRGMGVRATIKRGQSADGGPFTFLNWKSIMAPSKGGD